MKIKNLLLISILFVLGCQKELSITEFTDDFLDYSPELRIEALILPTENTAIVRIDKSVTLTDSTLYDCLDNDYGRITQIECESLNGTWHGNADSTVANCGNWNPLLHDLGIDGQKGDPTDDDGDCENCGTTNSACQESCRDEDSIGENNGIPDCNEPNVDNYEEFLPNIHVNSGCNVSIIKTNNSIEEICEFVFDPTAGEFFNIRYGGKDQLVDDFYTVNYGAWVPSNCSDNMWLKDDGNIDTIAEYSFSADCTQAGFGEVTSEAPINLSEPVVFVNTIQNNPDENPIDKPEISLLLQQLGIKNCSTYDCLVNDLNDEYKNIFNDEYVYFPRYSPFASIIWATISPNVYFEATEYFYDSTLVHKYFHGHPSIGTDFFNIVDNVCLMSERLFTNYYDGYGNSQWDDDSDDNNAEIFADENGNGKYDEGEFFIDRADNIGDIDKYYYKISTFSESYKNYYFNPRLLPNDPVRSNLRDENMNTIMGAFGSITNNEIKFQLIDCLDFIDSESSCTNPDNTHGVCSWYQNVIIDDYTGPACLPINWSF